MKEIIMPQMGQSVEEAAITQWLKKEGDTVAEGEPIFTIQTDKAEIECEATDGGVLRKILVEEDVDVPVLTVVALVGTADEAMPDLAQYAIGGTEAPAEEAPAAAPAPAAPAPAPTPAPAEPAPEAAAVPAPAQAEGESFASPRARAAGKRLDIDPTTLTGSGPGGRVLEEDVLAYHAAQEAVPSTPSARRMAKMEGVDLTAVEASGPRGRVLKEDVSQVLASGPAIAAQAPLPEPGGDGTIVPLTPMRRVIAQRMVESKFSAPEFYITIEVDMKNSVAFRKSLPNFKPSFNDLVLRATVRALQDFPQVNARWLGDGIEELPDINIGFATALPAGLIVPVIKQAQKKSLQDINRETKELAEKAQAGKLKKEDFSGNTFTVSNLGAFGVDTFTAIINQPDSAILAVGQIKERVVVIDGGIQIRPIMKLTLSSDHRVIDGAVAAQFMGRLRQILENADF